MSTLTIDDFTWPIGDLNELNAISGIPFPNWLAYTLYQPLVVLNGSRMYPQQGSGSIEALPALAQNWTVSSDGTTYTFKLRPGVTFSNGDPLNSYQIWAEMYGFYYLTGNASSWYISYNMFNMSSSNFGPSVLALMNSSGALISPSAQLMSIMTNNSWPIYVVGSDEIVFHTRAAIPWFPEALVAFTGLIFDTQYVLEHGGFGAPGALNTYFNQNPIPGTGPYMVTSVSEQAYVQFEQNPNYWGRNLSVSEIQANPYLDPGHVKNVVINSKTDDLTRYLDLASGKAQIASIQTQDWPLVLTNPDKYSYFVMPNNSMVLVGIGLNTQRYPTNITAVRQAIEHAINYTDVASKAFFGELSPMVGPEYPAQQQFYNLGNLPPYNYNLTLARQILNQSSIDTSKFPALEFRVETGCAACIAAAQVVQGNLADIGISVDVEVTPGSQMGPPLVGGGSYSVNLQDAQTISQLTWMGGLTFAPDEPTPADPWFLWVSNQSASANYAIYSNPVVQACVDAFSNGSSTPTLTSLCTQAQAQIYHDAPYVWLGSVKLLFGGGSVVWQKNIVKSLLVDPDYSGQAYAVFNTVTFVGS